MRRARGESTKAIGALTLALALAGCPPPPPSRPVVDAGRPVRPDAGQDAAVVDASLPDAGPAPIVVPAQSWIVHALVDLVSVDMTLTLEPRGEWGTVRAVAGGGGHATSVTFDIGPDGLLTARSSIRLASATMPCGYDALRVRDLVLQFADGDADGSHETLHAVAAASVAYVSSGSPEAIAGIAVREIVADTFAPTLAPVHTAMPLFGDPVALVASEPIDPSYVPRLVGPTSVALVPESGAGAAASWRTSTLDLAPGHYELMSAVSPRDLSGLAAVEAPTLSLDVEALVRPAIDDLGPAVLGVVSPTALSIVGDEAGEVPIVGATSLAAGELSAIVFDSPAGAQVVRFRARFMAPASLPFVLPFLTVTGADGRVLGVTVPSTSLERPSTIAGYDLESVPTTVRIPFTARAAGRHRVVLAAGGVDSSCLGSARAPGVGIVIDDITLE